ncbi:MAG: tRNA 2-thiouridine(34) synthase MnmA [Bacteroidetes bacterium]|nr:tRNA 2-thiouridine(34) synthase MnmA [Bacteroidota bacterium]
MNIAALVSGGVDSSVTIPRLVQMGYNPTIFYIKIGMENEPGYLDCPSEEDIEITAFIANKYKLKFEIVDLQKIYWERVISYTLDEVKKGLTPNPDVMCNRMIKFGAFEEQYGKDFDLISTGHYARIKSINNKKYLATSADKRKDQTYFLGQITQQQVNKLIFPIGDLQKNEVRRLAVEMKLPSANRPDSQGICFLGKINYNDFIRRYVGEKSGDIIEFETGKKLGQHKGFWFHTIGQRKGLGLSQGPWFVVKKDTEQNIIYVSNGYDPTSQYGNIVNLKHFQFINEKPDQDYSSPKRIKFKIRHTPEFSGGTLVKKGNLFVIDSDEKIAGIAAGQFGVIYNKDEEICLGSGAIS